MKLRGFTYRPAAALIRPDLLAKLPQRLPTPGEQLSLFIDDDQRQAKPTSEQAGESRQRTWMSRPVLI